MVKKQRVDFHCSSKHYPAIALTLLNWFRIGKPSCSFFSGRTMRSCFFFSCRVPMLEKVGQWSMGLKRC